MRPPLVTLITAAGVVPEPMLIARIEALGALPAEARGRVAVQLRDPELGSRALLGLGERLRDATGALGVALIVNDRIDLALLLGADGVHLGRRSVRIEDARALVGRTALVSVACHDVEDVARAAEAGADAAVLSPIFATPGKGPPIGVEALREARRRIGGAARTMGLIALGGVDASSASACIEAGADGVAAIRADPAALLRAVRAGRITRGAK
ncbi:MAG: thiamine phosphate synthase [Polyangiaceae bacterium]|nr:thiamine phosphate synthase [Polyangiaceae bacterium]